MGNLIFYEQHVSFCLCFSWFLVFTETNGSKRVGLTWNWCLMADNLGFVIDGSPTNFSRDGVWVRNNGMVIVMKELIFFFVLVGALEDWWTFAYELDCRHRWESY